MSIADIPLKARRFIVGAAAAVVLATGAAGYFYYQGHHAAAEGAKVQVEQSAQTADKATLEAQGTQESVVRIQVTQDRISAVQDVVSAHQTQAIQAEDAHALLDPARAARLLTADDRLCSVASTIPGCAPASVAGAR